MSFTDVTLKIDFFQKLILLISVFEPCKTFVYKIFVYNKLKKR